MKKRREITNGPFEIVRRDADTERRITLARRRLCISMCAPPEFEADARALKEFNEGATGFEREQCILHGVLDILTALVTGMSDGKRALFLSGILADLSSEAISELLENV